MWGRLGEVVNRMVSAIKPRSWSFRNFDWRPYNNRVTPEKALTLSTFCACIKFISGNIHQLPWKVYRPTSGKPHNADMTHPAYWVLDKRANPEQSAAVWRELMIFHALVYGNCYSEIQRDTANRVVALWPIEPWRVTPDRDDNGNLIYIIDNGTNQAKVIMRPMDVFHVPGLGDGATGFGLIDFAARSLGLAINADEYGLSFFGNSGVPSGVLKHPGKLSAPASERLKESLKSFKGSARANQTLVLEEGMEYVVTGLPPEQSQFLSTRQFSVDDICRWFNVPPSKVGQMAKASYNTIEQIGIEVVTDCLMPWIKKFEQEADYKILSDNRGSVYSKLDLRGLLRSTHADRSTYYRSLFSIGAVSINEIREWEDLDPIKNGDLHMVPMNMVPLERAINPPKNTGNQAQGGSGESTDNQDNKGSNPGGVPKVARTYLNDQLKKLGFESYDAVLDDIGIEANEITALGGNEDDYRQSA